MFYGYYVNMKPPEANQIRLGLLLPLTGASSDSAEYIKRGVDLALEKIRQEDADINIGVFSEDTERNPVKALSSIKKLFEFDKVKYIIGPYASSEVLAVAPYIEMNKIITFIPGAQTEEISDASDYCFRIIHNTKQEAPIFAKYIKDNQKGKNIDFVAIDAGILESYIKYFKPVYEAGGNKIGLVEKYPPTTSDFKDILTKIKYSESEAVFLMMPPKHIAMALKQMRDLNITNKEIFMLGVEGKDILDVGDAANGVYYPYSYDGLSQDQSVKSFTDIYTQKYNEYPETLAVNSFDSVMLLYKCYKDNPNSNTQRIKDCLYGIKNYHGASGVFSIDEKGDAVKRIIIKTIKNGKFVTI